ncbi:MAG: hypothetical protein C4321_04385, partial [Chloroflexota bacterium]
SIGRFSNVRNIEGYKLDLSYVLGAKAKLYFTGTTYNQPRRGPRQKNNIEHFLGGIAYDLSSSNNVDLGVELANFYQTGPTITGEDTLNLGGSVRERFYNIGFGHSFSPNMSFKILYQIVETVGSGAPFAGGQNSANGNVAMTQFTVRF